MDRLRANHYLRVDDTRQSENRASGLFSLDSKNMTILFTSVLFIHYLVAMYAVFKDYRGVFSPGRQVADYIRRNKLDREQIVVMPDYCATNLSANLNRKVYSLWNNQEITFEPLNLSGEWHWAPVVSRACALSDKWNRPYLLVAEKPLSLGDQHQRFDLIKSFDKCIVSYDSMHLYWVRPVAKRSQAQ